MNERYENERYDPTPNNNESEKGDLSQKFKLTTENFDLKGFQDSDKLARAENHIRGIECSDDLQSEDWAAVNSFISTYFTDDIEQYAVERGLSFLKQVNRSSDKIESLKKLSKYVIHIAPGIKAIKEKNHGYYFQGELTEPQNQVFYDIHNLYKAMCIYAEPEILKQAIAEEGGVISDEDVKAAIERGKNIKIR
ncbi:MAG: hypothetical protein ACI9BF_000560 [Candidatus Paceibacteria bacterium]|jgi:hypothetical protein